MYQDLLVELITSFPDTNITTIRILHDYRQVSFHPFLQVLGSVKSLSSFYSHVVARIAYIIRDLSIEILLPSIAQVSQDKIERRLFRSNEELKALEWLLEEPSKEE